MRHAILLGGAVLLLWGCGNENKLEDEPDPGGWPGGSDPGKTTTPVDTTGAGPVGDTATDPLLDPPTDDTGPTTDPLWTGSVPTNPTEDEICELAAALALTLDPYQTPGDGRVVYCHSGSGSSYNYIETDISSCLPHLNHDHDVFPTTGCDS